MRKKFEINRTKIKGGCQSGRKVVSHDSKSDYPLAHITHHMSHKILSVYVTTLRKRSLIMLVIFITMHTESALFPSQRETNLTFFPKVYFWKRVNVTERRERAILVGNVTV